MINHEDTNKLSKVTRVSFLQSHVTAATTAISNYPVNSGPYNDAVLELARLTYWLTAAKQA